MAAGQVGTSFLDQISVLQGAGRMCGFPLATENSSKRIAQILGEGFHRVVGLLFRSLIVGENRSGDVLLHFLLLAERWCLGIDISLWRKLRPE